MLSQKCEFARSHGGCGLSTSAAAGVVGLCRYRARSWFATLGLLAIAGFYMQIVVAPAIANDDTRGMTREQGDAILQELKWIRELLEQQKEQQTRPTQPTSTASDTARISVRDRPGLGASDAPVTVVEFTDYECPFCKRFHQTTFNSLSRDYVDTGKVRWVVIDLPLPMHPNARKAAQVAHCAGEQNKFWEMRQVLFDQAPVPEPEALSGYGKKLTLDQKAFDDCLADHRYLNQIDADSAAAAGIRITGTPSFIVGKSGGDWIEGKKIIGAQSFAVFDSAIRLILAEQSPPTD